MAASSTDHATDDVQVNEKVPSADKNVDQQRSDRSDITPLQSPPPKSLLENIDKNESENIDKKENATNQEISATPSDSAGRLMKLDQSRKPGIFARWFGKKAPLFSAPATSQKGGGPSATSKRFLDVLSGQGELPQVNPAQQIVRCDRPELRKQDTQLYAQRTQSQRKKSRQNVRPTPSTLSEAGEEGSVFEKFNCFSFIPVVSIFSVQTQMVVVIMLLVSGWTGVTTPLWLAFPGMENTICIYDHCLPVESEIKWIDHVCDMVYFVCTVAHLGIAFLDDENKEEVLVPLSIIRHRFHSCSWYADLLSCIPLKVEGSFIIAALKLTRVHQLILPSVTFQHLYFTAVVQITRLVAMVLYSAHLVAVIWLHSILTSDSLEMYLEKQVWAGSTTTGYLMALRDATFMMINRPVQALTDAELLICILMAPIGAIVVALFFGSVNWLFQRLNARNMQNYEELSTVRQVLRTIKVPAHVQARVMNYYRYTQIHDHAKSCDILFERVSPTLKLELKFYLYAELLASTPFFADVDPTIMKALVLVLELRIYAGGDFVICRNDSAEAMFFICRGTTEVLLELDQQPVANFEAGQHFGEMALYRSVERSAKRTAWVRAVSYCHLARLSRDAFEDLLDEFPDDSDSLLQKIGDSVDSAPWMLQQRQSHLQENPMTLPPQYAWAQDLRESISEECDSEGEPGVSSCESSIWDPAASGRPLIGLVPNSVEHNSESFPSNRSNGIESQSPDRSELEIRVHAKVEPVASETPSQAESPKVTSYHKAHNSDGCDSKVTEPDLECADVKFMLCRLCNDAVEQREVLRQHARMLMSLMSAGMRQDAGLQNGKDERPEDSRKSPSKREGFQRASLRMPPTEHQGLRRGMAPRGSNASSLSHRLQGNRGSILAMTAVPHPNEARRQSCRPAVGEQRRASRLINDLTTAQTDQQGRRLSDQQALVMTARASLGSEGSQVSRKSLNSNVEKSKKGNWVTRNLLSKKEQESKTQFVSQFFDAETAHKGQRGMNNPRGNTRASVFGSKLPVTKPQTPPNSRGSIFASMG